MMGVYIYHPTIHLPWSDWITPLQTHPSQSQDLSAANRPRIELRPEDHAYRPPVTQHLNWRITSGQRRPDGVLKQIYLINGVYPILCLKSFAFGMLTLSIWSHRSLPRPHHRGPLRGYPPHHRDQCGRGRINCPPLAWHPCNQYVSNLPIHNDPLITEPHP
jgi:hypothetical protein